MDGQKTGKLSEEILSRRSFLSGLGKWSAVVIAAAAFGVREAASAPNEELYENDDLRPDSEASSVAGGPDSVDVHRCRVWGNRAGCRVWGNAGCRVWGNR
jgi:hypothetical protein